VGFVVDEVALEHIFYKYFGYSCQSSFHQILHLHNHNRPEVADVPSGPSLDSIPTMRIKKKQERMLRKTFENKSECWRKPGRPRIGYLEDD
jgi:hypothetical protein